MQGSLLLQKTLNLLSLNLLPPDYDSERITHQQNGLWPETTISVKDYTTAGENHRPTKRNLTTAGTNQTSKLYQRIWLLNNDAWSWLTSLQVEKGRNALFLYKYLSQSTKEQLW